MLSSEAERGIRRLALSISIFYWQKASQKCRYETVNGDQGSVPAGLWWESRGYVSVITAAL